MKTIAFTFLILVNLFTGRVIAQTSELSIEESYDQLTAKWSGISEVLKVYSGFSEFCLQPEFRSVTFETLHLLHHYDSVVLDFLAEPSTQILIGAKEYQKALKEIEAFESGYGIQAFIQFLKESCSTRNEIEKRKKESSKDTGMYSYDGQILVLETDVAKFLKHLSKRIISIDEHIHRIHPDRFQFGSSITRNDD